MAGAFKVKKIMVLLLAFKAILIIKTVTTAELVTTETVLTQPLVNAGTWYMCIHKTLTREEGSLD